MQPLPEAWQTALTLAALRLKEPRATSKPAPIKRPWGSQEWASFDEMAREYMASLTPEQLEEQRAQIARALGRTRP